MLGLLLLQVLVSCLLLGHSEVVPSFKNPCSQVFYMDTPPSDSLRPTNAARICQVYDNKYRFATMYDRDNRIPMYSAYIYQPGHGDRSDSWFVEPQLIKHNYRRDMDTQDSIIETYGITPADIGKSQAIDKDYSDAQGLDRCHLCPSGHQSGDDKKATFTLTNIVPLYSKLNQGGWRIYEDKTMAQKTKGCDKTYVITGAVPGNTYISDERVNVPSHIWSAACCVKGTTPIKAWGAIAENDRNSNYVRDLELWDLEKMLSGLYGKLGITLFKNSCAKELVSHP